MKDRKCLNVPGKGSIQDGSAVEKKIVTLELFENALADERRDIEQFNLPVGEIDIYLVPFFWQYLYYPGIQMFDSLRPYHDLHPAVFSAPLRR